MLKASFIFCSLLFISFSIAQNKPSLNYQKGQVTNAIYDMNKFKRDFDPAYTGKELAEESIEKLAQLKKDYPDFDATAFDNQISDFIQTYDYNNTAVNDRGLLREEFEKQYAELFEKPLAYEMVRIGEAADEAIALAFIKEYETKINTFLAMDCAKLGKELNDWPASTKVHNLKGVGNKGLNLNYYKPTGENEVLTDYYKLQLEFAWVNGLKQLFGEIENVMDDDKKLLEAQAYLQSPSHAIDIANENAVALIAGAKLNPEAMTNTSLLNQIKVAVQKSSFGSNQDIRIIRITTNSWKITRHWLSGEILYREVGVQMVTNEGGKCILHSFIATEEFNGSNYAPCYVGFHNKRQMLCENAK